MRYTLTIFLVVIANLLFADIQPVSVFPENDQDSLVLIGKHPVVQELGQEGFIQLQDSLAGKKSRFTSAILSFPFPFGFLGMHRLYLGTDPKVPLMYVLTLGGGFGILPLIDFVAILTTRDLEKFANNSRVLMWTN